VKLLIAGAGGHGRVVAEAAESTGQWTEIAFLDDRHPAAAQASGWPIVGSLGELERLAPEFAGCVAAFGDSALRLGVLARARAAGFKSPVIVHARAAVRGRARLGPGTVVFAGAVVNLDAVFGTGCIVNTGATVDHDCDIGDGVHICPGVHLAGSVKVADACWIGIGSCVIQGIRIGARATVGAGAVVIRDVAAGHTVVGNPAWVLRHE
jgi:sugar O-acyltransferase (sialic acid O-acetyltransferase NeuD family)